MRFNDFTAFALSLLLSAELSLYAATVHDCRKPLKAVAIPASTYFPRFKNYNDAIRSALSWLHASGFRGTLESGWSPGKLSSRHTESTLLSSFKGFGPNGERVTLRIEIHPIKELGEEPVAHINVQFGKEKGPHFIFPGNPESVNAILKQLEPVLAP